jgi:thymidylate synthase
METRFKTASDAFNYFYPLILFEGEWFDDTKALFNIGFYIENPKDTAIYAKYRKWNPTYALREWNWYLSGNPNAEEISKFAPIWKNMMDENGDVRSNYGWQWQRNKQFYKVVQMLKEKPNTRKAVISIYDGKEIDTYSKDTPCTYAVQFTITNNKLNMTVLMRSNDLWYGFCNDQYCFSMLQQMVADRLSIDVGYYYHFAHNLHLYKPQMNKI